MFTKTTEETENGLQDGKDFSYTSRTISTQFGMEMNNPLSFLSIFI